MPLIRKKSLSKPSNDMPKADDLSIAYNVQKNNRKKMARGGMAENTNEPSMPQAKPDNHRLDPEDYMSTDKWAGGPDPIRKPDDKRLPEEEYMSTERMSPMLARGGMIETIMANRKAKLMADGGMVDIEENGTETPSMMAKNNTDEYLKKENYDEDFRDMTQPADSNEHGDKLEDEDSNDMISKIRSKMSKKRGI